jgi:CubicO group peptidase (beta-lactamase class C family)
MLDNGSLHGATLLQPETAKLMHLDQLDSLSFRPGLEFGFGFDIAKEHPRKPDGAYGWGGAFSTIFWIDPVNDLIVIQLRQVLSSPFNNDINSKLEKIVYSALANPK